MPWQLEDIKRQSILAFERFKTVWEFKDFWKRGNTFDACLNFASALNNKFPNDPEVKRMQMDVGDMLEVNYHYFMSLDRKAMWADDFGWWGLMGLNARTHLLRIGGKQLADKYLALSVNLCWRQEKEHAYDSSSTAKPVPHGCTNSPANGSSVGVKNTVTNILFFLLSTRIYRLSLVENILEREEFLDIVCRQWTWFESWFKLTQYQYLKKISSGAVLIQERPTAFFDGSDYQDTNHPTWEKDWIWSGDQGMLLAALTDLLAVKDNLAAWIVKTKTEPAFDEAMFESRLKSYIHAVSKGVKLALTGGADKVLREAPFQASFGPEFGNDYLAGRGILMRYLGKLPATLTGTDFRENIKATVKGIWQTRDQVNNQFQPEFTSAANDELYVAQFRKMVGAGDEVRKWQIAAMEGKQKFAVCQSIGLDAYGAYLEAVL